MGEWIDGVCHPIKQEDINIIDLIKNLELEGKLSWTNIRMLGPMLGNKFGFSGDKISAPFSWTNERFVIC